MAKVDRDELSRALSDVVSVPDSFNRGLLGGKPSDQ